MFLKFGNVFTVPNDKSCSEWAPSQSLLESLYQSGPWVNGSHKWMGQMGHGSDGSHKWMGQMGHGSCWAVMCSVAKSSVIPLLRYR